MFILRCRTGINTAEKQQRSYNDNDHRSFQTGRVFTAL